MNKKYYTFCLLGGENCPYYNSKNGLCSLENGCDDLYDMDYEDDWDEDDDWNEVDN